MSQSVFTASRRHSEVLLKLPALYRPATPANVRKFRIFSKTFSDRDLLFLMFFRPIITTYSQPCLELSRETAYDLQFLPRVVACAVPAISGFWRSGFVRN